MRQRSQGISQLRVPGRGVVAPQALGERIICRTAGAPLSNRLRSLELCYGLAQAGKVDLFHLQHRGTGLACRDRIGIGEEVDQ